MDPQKSDTRETGTYLDKLPEDVHRHIISFLQPFERVMISRLNAYWRTLVTDKFTKLAFVPNTPYGGRSDTGYKFLFENHAVFLVNSWNQTVDFIRECSRSADITSIKIVCCTFFDTADWTNIGQCLQHMDSLTIENSRLNVAQINQIISGTTSLVDVEILADIIEIRGLPEAVRAIFQNNRALKHFALRDRSQIENIEEEGNEPDPDKKGKYKNVVVRSQLQSIHISVRWGFDSYFWYSLKARCLKSLVNFSCEYFKPAQQRFLRFDNLTDFRIGNVDYYNLSPQIFESPNYFPVLKAFTLHVAEPWMTLGHHFQAIFIQSPSLKVLNVNVFLRFQVSLLNICDRYHDLEQLVLNIDFSLSQQGIEALATLTQLRYLVINDTYRNSIPDEALAVIISQLPQLRVIQLPSRSPIWWLLYHNTVNALIHLIISNPDDLFFITMPGNAMGPIQNAFSITDRRFVDIFLLWRRPCFLLYSYFDWERITQGFLNRLFN